MNLPVELKILTLASPLSQGDLNIAWHNSAKKRKRKILHIFFIPTHTHPLTKTIPVNFFPTG